MGIEAINEQVTIYITDETPISDVLQARCLFRFAGIDFTVEEITSEAFARLREEQRIAKSKGQTGMAEIGQTVIVKREGE